MKHSTTALAVLCVCLMIHKFFTQKMRVLLWNDATFYELLYQKYPDKNMKSKQETKNPY
jgi:hypothetical protein